MLCDKTDFISFILRKTEVSHRKKNKQNKTRSENKQIRKNKQTKRNRTSYVLPHAFMEDTIRHNIAAQVKSTSKAYIPYLLAIIIK